MKVQIGVGGMEIKEMAAFCGGTVIGVGSVSSLCTDSREATDGQTMFAAIVGERVDGHDYMRRAYDSGCRFFLCQRIPEELNGCEFGAVVVADTVKALGDVASAYAARLGHPAVGVTGSVGKTTTKEFICAVLSEKYAIHKTKANHNSTIGVPMSMLEATEREDLSVVEMGMSGLGEIEQMSRIAKPRVACITNVGSSHLELLGTRENICRAKLEMVAGLSEDGVLIMNGDEPLLRRMCPPSVKAEYISLEGNDADVCVSNIRYNCDGSVFDIRFGDDCYTDIRLSAIGRQFVWAAAFAISVGRKFGMDIDTIRRGLLRFENAAMRQSITVRGGITFIEDCYNASPESVRAAIDVMETLAGQTGARRIAMLGDMLELGSTGEQLHASVGEYYARKGGDLLFTMGPLSQNMAKGAMGVGMDPASIASVPCYDEAAVAAIGDQICHVLAVGDIFLVKASRSVGAERVLRYVKTKLFGEEEEKNI